MHNCHSFGNRKRSRCMSKGACGDFVGETEEINAFLYPNSNYMTNVIITSNEDSSEAISKHPSLSRLKSNFKNDDTVGNIIKEVAAFDKGSTKKQKLL